MNSQNRQVLRISALWIGLALVAILVLVLRLQLTFDLSVFFPQKSSLSHEILLEQLKNGPGSRLIVIGISGSDHDTLAEFSDQMKQELSADPAFLNVLNGDFAMDAVEIPEPVNSYYLLLDDLDFSRESLRESIQSRHRDLAFGGGATLMTLMARDPFLSTLKTLERLMPVNNSAGTWFAADGSAVLLAETKAPAVDISAQTEAVSTLRQVFSGIPGSDRLGLELTGVGAFGVELQKTIRAEAKKRTILATATLLVVLLLVYRRPRFLLLAALPVGVGFLVGLAVVTLIFGNVHGITLAFGFTLMGVAIDYPLHLFSHSRQGSGNSPIQRIWPTLRLGAISTAIAYLAISLSGSNGLAQLGIFTASGVLVAVLVTRSWLPFFIAKTPRTQAASDHSIKGLSKMRPMLSYWPAGIVLVLALFATWQLAKDGLWDDGLSSLSPVPEQRLKTDGLLRSAAGTADMRYQLVLHAPDLETLLRENEAVDRLLQKAADDGLLESWQSVSLALPSQSVQATRRAAIPDAAILHTRLSEVLSATPFRQDAFLPFEINASRAKTLQPLLPEQFEATPLKSWLDSHLVHLAGQWVALITMSQPSPEELTERVKTWEPKVELVDLHQSSLDVMRDYRMGALRTISLAMLVILLLLLFERKEARNILWTVLTVVTSLAVTIAIVTAVHGGLTIIHMVALLLVMGLGLDYALFVGRTETGGERRSTRHAVAACALTTSLTFAILADSSIPLLRFLGLTVAVGSAASFVMAFAGSLLSRKVIS